MTVEIDKKTYRPPMVHKLKVWYGYFGLLQSGVKQYEVRINDRDFRVGDELLLQEFDQNSNEYTGRFLHRRIDHILNGGVFGIEKNYVILSISKI